MARRINRLFRRKDSIRPNDNHGHPFLKSMKLKTKTWKTRQELFLRKVAEAFLKDFEMLS